MIVSLVVAIAKNGVIGKGNKLPWRLSTDLRHFKKLTLGHHIVMGRKTFESIGKPLEGRVNIVLTHNRTYHPEGVLVMHSLKEVITFCKNLHEMELFIIGGSEIFKEALPLANKIYLTHIDAEVDGDVHFPEWDEKNWKPISEERFAADDKNQYPFSIKVYERPDPVEG